MPKYAVVVAFLIGVLMLSGCNDRSETITPDVGVLFL